MTGRHGIISSGTWCVDHNLTIDHWPEQESIARILETDAEGGGCGFNLAVGLSKLGYPDPLYGLGVLGDDENSVLLKRHARNAGIDVSALQTIPGATSYTLCLAPQDSGKRTHIFQAGVNAALTADHFDFRNTNARLLHTGLPGVHAAMDKIEADGTNGWSQALKKAQAAGLETNMELVSVSPQSIRDSVLPCLPHLTYLIVNDHEIGALAEVDCVDGGDTDVASVVTAAKAVLERGAMEIVAVHFPMGCVAVSRTGDPIVRPSVAIPAREIVGTNGAGDAFAAGLLFHLTTDGDLDAGLRLAHAAAAASVRAASTIGSIASAPAVLELADRWGWRDAPWVSR